MTTISTVGTHLPRWGTDRARVAGPDQDAVTLGVAAGVAALRDAAPDAVRRVVFVTRDLPLLEGGNGAPLLAGLGLRADVPVTEQIGGAPAVLDALVEAGAGTLVVAVDLEPAGAAAALTGDGGASVALAGRVVRSLPIRTRSADGRVDDYQDPRLLRERGIGLAVEALDLPGKPDVVAGLAGKQAAALCAGRPPALPTTGASSTLFALAALADDAPQGLLLAVEQGSATAVSVEGAPVVHRDEQAPRPAPDYTWTSGDISISLPAYERAYEPKLRWEAAKCDACGTLAFPPRYRCLDCGSEAGWTLTPLPRTGEVYTTVTIHVAVPGLPTPYSLAIVELDGGSGVRALVKVTGAVPGTVQIGDRGRLVLHRVAVRSGVPDYGYGFLPDDPGAPEDAAGMTTEGIVASGVTAASLAPAQEKETAR